MKIQIVGPDNQAAIDGEWFPVNLAAFGWHPAYHAVYYNDAQGGGHIEWVSAGGITPPNQAISRDQLLAMFGPIIEHTRTMIAAKRALEEAKKQGAS